MKMKMDILLGPKKTLCGEHLDPASKIALSQNIAKEFVFVCV